MSPVDNGILLVYLLAVVLLGGYFARGQKSLREFFLAGYGIPWWAAALSGIATMMSAVGYLGAPGQAYDGDWRYLQLRLAVPTTILITTVVVLPFFYKTRVYTAYEYLDRRFDRKTRLLAALLFVFLKCAYAGVAIFAPALVVAEMTGWSVLWIAAGIGLLTTLYTTMGGIRAVIWTDSLQMVVLSAGIFAALWVAISKVDGGFGFIWQTAWDAGKLRLWDLSPSLTTEFTVWGGLIGGTFYLLSQYAVDQAEIQRFLTTRSTRDCQVAMVWSLGVNAVYGILLFFVGTALWVFYMQQPDATATAPDSIFPKFIIEEFPAGLRGLPIAGVFAASMSTVSSVLNSLATVFVRDFWEGARGRAASVRWARYATIVFGAIATAISLYSESFGNILVAAGKIRSFFGGILVGLFLLGILSQRATGGGAFWGVMVGFVGVAALSGLTNVSWLWYSAFSAVLTYAAGLAFSRFEAPPADRQLDGLVWRRRHLLLESAPVD